MLSLSDLTSECLCGWLIPFKALQRVAYFIILAAHDNEQSDLLHRIKADTR